MTDATRRYTRADLPEDLGNVDEWPQVDSSHLPEEVQDVVGRRQKRSGRIFNCTLCVRSAATQRSLAPRSSAA